MSERWRILITGVGGQGVLSAARWLGEAAATNGFSIAVSELHGMSQRGGSVQSEVAIGGMRSLIANSRGVDGYHLNDETATWEWLDQTGTVPEVFFHAPPETGEEGA